MLTLLRSKEGFTVTRAKRDWTDELADEAAQLFEQGEGEIVLGDSVGLISSVTEILSQPADVAILIASGNKGDDNEVYREVVQKWKGFYDMKEINLPLLVVVRSSLNPKEMSMFDPRDNYGVIVGLDRKAFEDGLINPQDACIEGIVFEIGQAFDLVFTSPMMPKHREVIAAKWPSVKDIDTWRPETAYNLPVEKREFLSRLEKEYFDSRRNPNFELFDEYGAEEPDVFVEERIVSVLQPADESLLRDIMRYYLGGSDGPFGASDSRDDVLTAVEMGLRNADRATLDEIDRMLYKVSQSKGAGLGAETFNAYSSRFSPKNPNTRSKLVSRGRRVVQADPEYQQFRKYSLGGLGILAAALYFMNRKSKDSSPPEEK